MNAPQSRYPLGRPGQPRRLRDELDPLLQAFKRHSCTLAQADVVSVGALVKQAERVSFERDLTLDRLCRSSRVTGVCRNA